MIVALFHSTESSPLRPEDVVRTPPASMVQWARSSEGQRPHITKPDEGASISAAVAGTRLVESISRGAAGQTGA
jgi:hypothetical protein